VSCPPLWPRFLPPGAIIGAEQGKKGCGRPEGKGGRMGRKGLMLRRYYTPVIFHADLGNARGEGGGKKKKRKRIDDRQNKGERKRRAW